MASMLCMVENEFMFTGLDRNFLNVVVAHKKLTRKKWYERFDLRVTLCASKYLTPLYGSCSLAVP
jgi:hypothetical protein